jgi:broad specificity phosphatase PhoE
MRTTMYLIRHAATLNNLARPYILQGRKMDPELAPIGTRQALATRDFLAVRTVDVCYASPMVRAFETARMIAEPHKLNPIPTPELIECDLGTWEGLTWEQIEREWPNDFELFNRDPGKHGYLGGETFTQVQERAKSALQEILERHPGKSILVVSHHVVNRVYLGSLLGLTPGQSKAISLENCGISVIQHESGKAKLTMLNSSFHLDGLS